MRRARGEHVAEFGNRRHAFADGDRHVRDLRNILEPAIVLGANRLFIKKRIGEFEFLGQTPRHRHIRAAMEIVSDIDVGADRVANGPCARHGGSNPAVGVDGGERGAGVHLDGPGAFADDASGLFRRCLGRIIVAAGPAVDLHPVAHAAPEQAVDGKSRRLAGYIPEGNLDAGQRAHKHTAAMIEAAVEEAAHQPLEVVCRLAREPLGHGVNVGARAFQMAFEREFAEALNAVRSQHAHQTPAGRHARGRYLLNTSSAHRVPPVPGHDGTRRGSLSDVLPTGCP